MRSWLGRLAAAFGGVAFLASAAAAAANDGDGGMRQDAAPRPRASERRELIAKDEDVAARIRSGAAGSPRHYDIEAEDDDYDAPLLLHVDQVLPAVTSDTTFHFHPSWQFRTRSIGDVATLSSDAARDGEFALLSVDTLSGDVRGLQRDSKGKTRQVSSEGARVHVRTMARAARNFTCGAEHIDGHDENHGDGHEHDVRHRERGLFRDYHDERSFRVFDPDEHSHMHQSDNERRGRRQFVINLLVLVDNAFIQRQGHARASVRYVDFLMNAANAIFGPEVDARLNVVRIEETDVFDGKEVKTLRDGLRVMRQRYEGTVGNGVDLIHALLGQDLGGGIAFIDSVCDDTWGVGLSSGLRGRISDLDDQAMNDAFVVAHEIGHSLGSGHTHDGYNPPVDTCGVDCPQGLQQKAATLMSYCNFCEGGKDNVAMTLGGVWSGRGSKLDVENWETSPEIAGASVSDDPRRVSHTIYKRLSGKGQCINPALQPTEQPTDAPTASPSRPPSYYPGVADGRRWVRPERHCMEELNCAAASGIMFDLEHADEPDSYGIFVEALQFEHMNRPNQTVDVYATINGSHVGIEQLSDRWKKIATVHVDEAQSYTEIVLDAPISISPGGKRGFYLVANSEEILFLVGSGSSSSSVNASDVSVSFRGGLVVFDTFGVHAENFYPIAQAGYTMMLPPTTSPTPGPSASPTRSPTMAPSVSPTTLAPSSSPIINHGPFSLRPENTCGGKDCSAVAGYMFSVKTSKKARCDIIISGVSLEHLAPKQYRFIELYRTYAPYSGKEQNPELWVKIASVKMPQVKFNVVDISLDAPIRLKTGEIVSFYLKTEENIILVAKNKGGVDMTTSDGRLQLIGGSAIMDGGFGAPFGAFSLNGAVEYSTAFT